MIYANEQLFSHALLEKFDLIIFQSLNVELRQDSKGCKGEMKGKYIKVGNGKSFGKKCHKIEIQSSILCMCMRVSECEEIKN